MSAWKKIALTAAGVGIAVYAYARKLKRTQANLIVIPQVSVQSIGLSGIVLRTDVQIKNPTDGSLTIKWPFVTLIYKDTLLGSSNVVDKDIPLKAYSQTAIDKIMIDIPLAGALTVVSDLIGSLQSKLPVRITVKVSTVVDLGWKKFDYVDTQEITLKN